VQLAKQGSEPLWSPPLVADHGKANPLLQQVMDTVAADALR